MDFIPLSAAVESADTLPRKFQTDTPAFKRHQTHSDTNSVGCRVGHSSIGCVLWKSDPHAPRIIRLHHEIKHFFEAMSPTPDEQATREGLVQRITEVVKKLWSGAKVEVFGSVKTGLYLPSSDLDIVIFGLWKAKPLHTLSDALIDEHITTREATRVIDKASVPIIKFTDTQTQIKVDISFNMTNGQAAVNLIQSYVQEFPVIPYLVLVLKQFLAQRDLNDVYTGGLGSYSLILMVVSFLQLHSRGEGHRPLTSGTGGSYNDYNFGVLLLEFFELYGLHFNYGWTGISVRDKGSYIRKTDDMRNGQTTLYIEDPSCPENDVSRGSYNIQHVQTAFVHAYRMLCFAVTADCDEDTSEQTYDLCDDSILSCIIVMPHQRQRKRLNTSSQRTWSRPREIEQRGSQSVPSKKSKGNWIPSSTDTGKKRHRKDMKANRSLRQ